MKRRVYIAIAFAAVGGVALLGWLGGRSVSPGPLASAHAALSGDCAACHDKGDHVDTARCAACHTDPATGAEFDFVGFAKHHAYRHLVCTDCHTEHGRADGQREVRSGIGFGEVPCETCHVDLAAKAISLAAIPASLRGEERAFPHDRHATETLSCTRCHPMAAGRTHALVGPYSENCSACHHGSGQRASCEDCHTQAADYFTGKFEGRPVRPGSHEPADDITCVTCHLFDEDTHTFDPPADTCATCHPAGYTEAFVKAQADWRQWRKTVDALPKDHPYAKQLQFVGRYWYHNDTQSAKVRRAYSAAVTPPKRPGKTGD